MTLREKRILITGGASGIGLAIAKRAAEEGSRIVVADISHDSQARWDGTRSRSTSR
jgi:NAD(P)-dependent dehydrogenase (short-subunit alcohol dehydrogenase family)